MPLSLAVVSSDSLQALVAAGYMPSFLKQYYNPTGMFETVYWLHPEDVEDHGTGMILRPTKPFWLKRTIRKIRPSVVRAYGGWGGELAIRRKVAGVPVVASVHDTNLQHVPPNISGADVVVCMSRIVKETVLNLGASEEQIEILPNRVDMDLFKPLPKDDWKSVRDLFPGGKLILHIGRKSPQKNLDTVLQALSMLPPEYFLFAVGRGNVSPYDKLAGELGVSDRCAFRESLPNDQLPLYYNAFDCFCVPSRWEGFGIVFIEALSCGRPVVTSDIAPMNEFIRHGYNGYLVGRYTDPASLAGTIEAACSDDQRCRTVTHHARESVQPFHIDLVAAQEAEIYSKAIRGDLEK